MTNPNSSESKLLEIVAAIGALTPEERRRLQRRLRVSGLWGADEYLADRDRLRVAPALGERISRSAPIDVNSDKATSLEGGAVPLQPSSADGPNQPSSPDPSETPSAEPAAKEYQSSVSGKVVVADDGQAAHADTPRTMAPLPGQAPEKPIGIIFDGGTRGDPALGYGSYAIRWPGMPQQVVRLRFGDDVNGEEAEYDTLIAALEATLQRLQDHGAAPDTARLDIRGDSKVVIGQVSARLECEEPSLQLRCDRVRFLLRRFGGWSLSRYHREPEAESTDE